MSRRFQAHLGLVLCSFLWGATFVIVKDALADSSVFAYLAARFVLGALLLIPLYLPDLRKMSRPEFRAGALIGVFMFGGYAFQTAGIAYTTPSKAAFITGFSVVLVPVFLALFWRSRINAWAWTGAFASLAGLYLLTVPRQGITDLNRGDMLVLVCAVLYAIQIILIARYVSEHSMGVISFMQVAVTAVLSAGCVPLLQVTHWEPLRFHLTYILIFAVVITGVFTTAVAYPLLVWAQRHTSATNTALILTTEPVFAAATSFLVLREHLGTRALTGAGLILAGILVAELKGPVQAMADTSGAVLGKDQA